MRGIDLARRRTEQSQADQPRQASHPFHILVALFSIVLITAPPLIGGGLGSVLLFLLPFLLSIAWNLPRSQRIQGAGLAGAALSLYLLIVVIELVRGAHVTVSSSLSAAIGDSLSFVVIAIFGITLLSSACSRSERWWRLAAVAFSPAIYVATNVVLLQLVGEAAGDTTVAQGKPAELLGLLGLSVTRVQFPLSAGVNAFGAVAAAGLAASILLLLRTPIDRRLSALAATVCLYGILTADSRGALLIALIIILLFWLVPRVRHTPWIAVLVLASPVLTVAGLRLLANSGLVSLFSRSGGDLLTATGRLQIWDGAWGVISHPSLQGIIGYGANGQITSGASAHYAYLFSAAVEPGTYSVHNLTLQTIFDAGYVGLIVTLGALTLSLMRLEKIARLSPTSPAPALLAILAVLFLNGATEASPSYLFPDTMALALLVMGVSVALAGSVEPPDSELSESTAPPPTTKHPPHRDGRRFPVTA